MSKKYRFYVDRNRFEAVDERDGTPADRRPPRPPVKSAPPISRIFPHKPQQRALMVSFKESADNSMLSPKYDDSRRDLYFDQCFDMRSKLGSGSFGEVFKARSREDGKLYAVKRSRERFRGESDRNRKLQEVAKHEKLPKHPNCVSFVKAWEEKQHLYIQTELCPTSLSNMTEHYHNIPETLIWNYMVDLLMAVKHLHDYDLIHMDLKPENIFISEDDTCKLGDFGLVLDLSKNIDLSEEQEGDPKYLAPELLQGQFGKPADIFSLGITILELASDIDLPRGGQLWHNLRSGQLPDEFLRGRSCELRRTIGWLMEPDPKKRPTVDEVLQSETIKNIWMRRRRQQFVSKMVSHIKHYWHGLVGFLFTLWMTITHPIHSLLPVQVASTPNKEDRLFHPPEWDHSFSDDDVFDEPVNLSNNSSLGVPLNYSTSSAEDCPGHVDTFAIPGPPAPRLSQTTPGKRLRSFRFHSPQTSSPIKQTAYSSAKFSAESYSPPATSNGLDDISLTPNSSFNQSQEEEEPAKLSIEPKNLLDAFESSEDD